MRIGFRRLPNRFPAGRMPVYTLIFMVLAYLMLHLGLEYGQHLCWFKALTGIPCPTCGLGRAYTSLLRGHPLQALSYNPFMLVFSLAFFGNQALILVTRHSFSLKASKREQNLLLVLFLLLLLFNWLYVIIRLD